MKIQKKWKKCLSFSFCVSLVIYGINKSSWPIKTDQIKNRQTGKPVKTAPRWNIYLSNCISQISAARNASGHISYNPLVYLQIRIKNRAATLSPRANNGLISVFLCSAPNLINFFFRIWICFIIFCYLITNEREQIWWKIYFFLLPFKYCLTFLAYISESIYFSLFPSIWPAWRDARESICLSLHSAFLEQSMTHPSERRSNWTGGLVTDIVRCIWTFCIVCAQPNVNLHCY